MSNRLLIARLMMLLCISALPMRSIAGSGKHKPAAQNKFTVTGDISGMPVQTILLEQLHPNDSVVLVDSQRSNAAGHFELSGSGSELSLYRLQFQSDRFILLSIDKGNIKVGSSWPVNDYTVEGSEQSARVKLFVDSVKSFMGRMEHGKGRLDSIRAIRNERLYNSMQNELQNLNLMFMSFVKKYSDTTPYQPNAILASRVMNPEGQERYFDSFNKSMDIRFPGTESTREYHQFFQKLKEMMPQPTDIGDKAPDVKLEDTAGKIVVLSSLKGKYVLLDFWASWCGPCRAENPNVLAAYKKYKDRNFTILAVSLDEKKEAWLKAVQHDGLLWPQVSDLKGWKSGVASEYGVHSIPTNFLIDPKGVIIAKSLRGPELESKLEEVLPLKP